MKKLLLLSFLLFLIISPAAAAENLIAVKAKKIVTVSGREIENGVILIRGDKIEKAGQNIAVPPGYILYDYGKYTVYPGLINSMTSLGLSGIDSIDMWQDTREEGKYKPHLSVYTAFYPWSKLIPNARQFGTLTAVAAPSGGVIPGKAVLVNLAGWVPGDMFIEKELALIVRLPESSRKKKKSSAPKVSMSKAKKELKKYFTKAQKYYLRAGKGISQDFNPEFEGMKALWAEGLPVIMSANSAADIRFAIKMGKEFKLKLILYGIYDGEDVLKEIKASGYPVILASMYNSNRDWEDGCDKVFRLPGALTAAGIEFAFSTGGAATAFDLPLHAGRAAAYGLTPTEAVKALTLYPARILGIEDYGSIAAGKIANLIVTDGDILETSTLVKGVFIKGRKIKGRSFFQQEYERAKDKISGVK